MVNQEYFKTEKYEFYFYHPKDRFERKTVVQVNIAAVERRNFTDRDISELNKFFNDMGKWERITEAGKSLLEDLGLATKVEEQGKIESGYENYNVKLDKKDDRVNVRITLTKEESLRRTKGDSYRGELSLEEITEQVKNVPKWQTLKKTLGELKEKP